MPFRKHRLKPLDNKSVMFSPTMIRLPYMKSMPKRRFISHVPSENMRVRQRAAINCQNKVVPQTTQKEIHYTEKGKQIQNYSSSTSCSDDCLATDEDVSCKKIKGFSSMTNVPAQLNQSNINLGNCCDPDKESEGPVEWEHTPFCKEASKTNSSRCSSDICTCKKHRCPSNNQEQEKRYGYGPQTRSEYKQKYEEYPLEVVKPIKSKHQPLQSGVFFSRTTNREDFIKHDLPKPTKATQSAYNPPTEKLNDETTYNDCYIPKEVTKEAQIKQIPRAETLPPFDGTPTYQADFRAWPIHKDDPKRHDDNFRSSNAVFYGKTSYMADYTQHLEKPRKSFKPSQAPRGDHEPLESLTNYKETFKEHPIHIMRPLKPEIQIKPKCSMTDISVSKSDFKAKSSEVRESCKPKMKQIDSNEPFSKETTHQIDYQPWNVKLPEKTQQKDFIPPEGSFDFSTTYRGDFRLYPITEVSKPTQIVSKTEVPGQFDGKTTYKSDFPSWDASKSRGSIDITNEWTPPNQPTDPTDYTCKTTSNINYVPDNIGHTE